MDLDFIISDGQGNYYHITDAILKSRKVVKTQTIQALNDLRAGKATSFAVLTGAKGDAIKTQKLVDLGNGVKILTFASALGITIC